MVARSWEWEEGVCSTGEHEGILGDDGTILYTDRDGCYMNTYMF